MIMLIYVHVYGTSTHTVRNIYNNINGTNNIASANLFRQ